MVKRFNLCREQGEGGGEGGMRETLWQKILGRDLGGKMKKWIS